MILLQKVLELSELKGSLPHFFEHIQILEILQTF